MITKVLHTGITVDELENAIKIYEKLGFTVNNRFDKPEPAAHVAQLTHLDGSGIELWQFIDKNHPEVAIIQRHIAVGSDDLAADLQALIDSGYQVVIPITKGVTLTYAFVKDPSGNYIEIAQLGS